MHNFAQPLNVISNPVASELLVAKISPRLGLSPYNIIVGRDTALPSPQNHSGATGMILTVNFFLLPSSFFLLPSYVSKTD